MKELNYNTVKVDNITHLVDIMVANADRTLCEGYDYSAEGHTDKVGGKVNCKVCIKILNQYKSITL